MTRAPLSHAAFAFLATVWFGVLLGVAFLATPVKFQAPSLNLPVALDVGRATFALLSKVEWGLGALLFAGALAAGRRVWIAAAVGLAALLAVQALWLLPVLDARVSLIIAGRPVAPSNFHLDYIAVDVVKALTLLGLSLGAFAGLRGPR